MSDNPKLKKCHEHDYRNPCIYLLTVTTEGRRPLLGRLEGDVYTAHIQLSDLGIEVRHELYALCDRYPQLRLLQYQIMPDHVHVILQATERLPRPIGSLFSSWKIACGRKYAKLSGTPAGTHNMDIVGASASSRDKALTGASASSQDKALTSARVSSRGKAAAGISNPTPSDGASSGETTLASEANQPPFRRLFDPGYNDSILYGKEQLQHMIAYVRDNPRRLLIKRQQGQFFSVQRGITVAGHTLDAVGNLSLLQRPLLAVHCRRHWSESEIQAYHDHCLSAAKTGTVLIGAFISKPEQAIAHYAQEHKLSIIHIMENGFPDLYKPVGHAFYACAEGRLLQISMWPYHTDNKPVRREQCNAMNTLAETIASTT